MGITAGKVDCTGPRCAERVSQFASKAVHKVSFGQIRNIASGEVSDQVVVPGCCTSAALDSPTTLTLQCCRVQEGRLESGDPYKGGVRFHPSVSVRHTRRIIGRTEGRVDGPVTVPLLRLKVFTGRGLSVLPA